jgi:uncharacterized membrane protein
MNTNLKNIFFFLVSFFILINNVDASGIAISPSNMTLDLSLNETVEKTIIIYNLGEEQTNISINIDRNLDRFIEIYDIDTNNINISGKDKKKIKIKIHIPENVNATKYSGNILMNTSYKYYGSAMNLGVNLPININVQDKNKKLFGFGVVMIITVLFMATQISKNIMRKN